MEGPPKGIGVRCLTLLARRTAQHEVNPNKCEATLNAARAIAGNRLVAVVIFDVSVLTSTKKPRATTPGSRDSTKPDKASNGLLNAAE
eukprot:4098803-Pyramimonas_sp.AAC.1